MFTQKAQQFLKELDVKKSNAENFIFTNYKPVISYIYWKREELFHLQIHV